MADSSSARLMEGTTLARRIKESIKIEVRRLLDERGVVPTVATVLIGDDPSSAVYHRTAQRNFAHVGIRCIDCRLGLSTTTDEALARMRALAEDASIHAILVQHPVPKPIDRRALFEVIPPDKDVDGVSSASLGRMILGMPGFAPCTPEGIMRLLAEYQVELAGTDAVVVGRSPILGRPLASMLINAHATVTLCHSKTRNLEGILRRCDLVIAAIGRPRYIQGEWIKPGAVVVDGGYNPGNVGDVDFDAVRTKASLITPVPGGVGPMTIAVLLEHIVRAAELQSRRAATKS